MLPAVGPTDLARLKHRGSLTGEVKFRPSPHASQGARISPGVTEGVDFTARFLPEVEAAIATGLADPKTLSLAGVRMLAQRVGCARATVTARELVALLPSFEPVVESE